MLLGSRNTTKSKWLRCGLVASIVLVLGGVLGMTACSSVTPPLKVTHLSQSEKDRRSAADLLKSWEAVASQFPNAVKPVEPRVRYVTLQEWPKADADCLTAHGFPATVGTGGAVAQHVVGGQEEAASIAAYQCQAMYPLDPQFNEPLNKSQLSFLYAYFIDKLTPCLTSAGYSIASPPSLQTFESSYNSKAAWSPYLSVPATDTNWDQTNKKCPQSPSGLYG